MTKKLPPVTQEEKKTPDAAQEQKPVPSVTKKMKAVPLAVSPENTVVIGGTPVEIKATKLKYQRNRTATFYKLLEIYPLVDIVAMEPGAFGDDGRDGDKALLDWLIAATDNEQLITENYDNMDTNTIEAILAIFKRVNKIDEKEAKLKKLEEAQKVVV